MKPWVWLMALVPLAGCGGGAKAPTMVTKEEPAVEREIVTDAAEVTRRGPDQSVLWTARSAAATLWYHGDEDFGGEFEQVSGRLFDEGRAVSDFSADQGQAERGAERLLLRGRVKITSMDPHSTLTAAEVLWRPERGLIEAKGDVRIATPEYDAGPFERLWATPDLRTFGTPDTFANQTRPSQKKDGPN